MRGSVGRVGGYEILRVLGRGGMATVYLARQDELDREVALKELRAYDDGAPGAARRFLREARLAGSLSHPAIVTVHEYLQEEGRPYIAMEYLPRGALRRYLGRLSLAQIGAVLLDVLAGLRYAGERDIVHRDLKPENILVTGEGRVKIADFGIAKAASATRASTMLTTAGTTLGTPRYMAPERALGQETGPESDLFSLGVIAFELLVGRTPFHETEDPMALLMRHINSPMPTVRSQAPDVDARLSDWVAGLLERDPAQRTPSAADAADELEGILLGLLGPRRMGRAALPERPGEPTSPRIGLMDGPARSRCATLPQPPPAAAPGFDDVLAPTLAPSARPAGRARRRRRRRPSRLLLPLAAALALLAGVAAATGLPGGGGPGPETAYAEALRGTLGELRRGVRAHRASPQALARDYDRAARALGGMSVAAGQEATHARLVETLVAAAEAHRAAAGATGRRDARTAAREAAADGDAALDAADASLSDADARASEERTAGGDEDEPDENDNGD